MSKKKNEPTVNLNLNLFTAIAQAEKEAEEARNSRIYNFMADDGETLILNALGELFLSSFKQKLPKDRGEGEKDNPMFGRTSFTVGMIYDQLPSDWKEVVKEADVSRKLVAIWKEQGNSVSVREGSEEPNGEHKGWLTAVRGQGRAGIMYGLDTSKLPEEVTGGVPEEK